MSDLHRKDTVYYTRIIPSSGIYDVLEIKIRTVENGWFAGIEKRDKQAYLFYDSDINRTIFTNRKDALDKVKAAEANKKPVNEETDYQEY